MTTPPWGFPEQRSYTNINTDQSGQDFYGIKTGDIVTDFANPANAGGNTAPFVLTAQDENLEAGSELLVEFRAGQFDDLAALQFGLSFEPEQLEFVDIQYETAIPLTADNLGLYNISEGTIQLAWSQASGIAVPEAAPVFRLKFRVLQSGGKLGEVLRLDESVLPGLAFSSALAGSKVELAFSEITATGDAGTAAGVQLLQNRPNPFRGSTTIGFVLPEGCEAQLRIFDASGRMLAERKAYYPAGRHEEAFSLDAAPGMLWYELATPQGILTKKMMLAK
jgi:hypothetical protein